jgi:pectin methylesterase-like acyl-CoA thioesterase
VRAREYAIGVALAAGVALSACSADQNAKITATATAIDQTAAAVEPVVNVTACKAQEAANLTTAALTQSHNTDAAAKSASASALLGLLCFTMPSAPVVAAAPAA